MEAHELSWAGFDGFAKDRRDSLGVAVLRHRTIDWFAGLMFGGRVRIVGPAIEFYDGGIKWFVHRLPHGQFTLALTLGHVILGQTDAALAISRRHEAVHVAQYERWGPLMLPAYLLSSCYVYFIGKRFYRDNPFEREAYNSDSGEHDK